MGVLCQKRTKDSKEERWKVTPQRPYILVDYKIGSVFNIGHGCARCSANTLHTRSRRAGAGGSVKPLSPHLQPSAPWLPGTYSVWRRQNSFQSDAECWSETHQHDTPVWVCSAETQRWSTDVCLSQQHYRLPEKTHVYPLLWPSGWRSRPGDQLAPPRLAVL